uniref:Chitin-binding type-4 domain-containing protein n=1 Tax=Psilocybe cubensis TaxID=181762 RepID=A0A8H8CFM7_PSICU
MFKVISVAFLVVAAMNAVVPAMGHGHVTIPPSRQERCQKREVPGCGNIQWEPQSVEAKKGSFRCDGGGDRFHELADEALWADHFLVVPPGVDSLNMTWVLTTAHRTQSWEYFVLTQNNTLLLSVQAFNTIPANPTTQLVPLKGIKGKHTILARWSIGDTENAFYACIDLFVEGKPTSISTSTSTSTSTFTSTSTSTSTSTLDPPRNTPPSIPGPPRFTPPCLSPKFRWYGNP